MTTLSKEDVVRMVQANWPSDRTKWAVDCDLPKLESFATLARADLVAENERLEGQVLARDAELWGGTQEILSLKDQLTATRTALAAAEAREGKLHKGLENVKHCLRGGNATAAYNYTSLVLAQPRDDSALREMISGAIDEFVFKFKRHVGGDGEFWLHELEDYRDSIRTLAEKAKGK